MEALGISHWEKSLPNLSNVNWHKFTQSTSEAVGKVIFPERRERNFFYDLMMSQNDKLFILRGEGGGAGMNFQTQFHGKSAERFHSLPQMSA